MSKTMKIIWAFISYAPLYGVVGIAMIIDSQTRKQITDQWWIGFVTITIAALCFLVCGVLLKFAKSKLYTTKLYVVSAESDDSSTMSSMVAYLLPLVTMTFAEINVWILGALILIIVLMLLWTKAILINPLVYIFNYRYYSVQTNSGVTYKLLSKQKRFDPAKVENVIELFNGIYMEV